ncbi:uncharacterized protein EV420DRAFT_308675 [Desarmillaria tabescens]|uniref:BTB domain-containing protein n=1 Tax=Armillaria tabescens TaxID=1929756 RepID=A0AA39KDX5_ARMTA|nr:uncharacterized protein EV420DRAFT_308675 [Desarmillaria tabescens]KAK0459207.1 hypothetical protein EV420DRAFT_308675 [Desarmillaria tabescens]
MGYERLEEPFDVMPMSQSPSRSENYYWEDVVVQVEDTLFRFPKHYLMGKSEAFKSMLSMPQGDNEPEGTSDDRPIKLLGISKVEFERLLQVLHPIDAQKEPNLSMDAWFSVMKLSSLWRLADTRNVAISHLTTLLWKIDPVDRVILGRKYSVAQWLSSGYMDLVHRAELLTQEEAEKIGLDTALQIQCVNSGEPSFDREKVKIAIEKAFKKELDEHEADGALFNE